MKPGQILKRLKEELVRMIEDIPAQAKATTIHKGYLRAVYQIQKMIEELEGIKGELPGEEDEGN